MLLAGYSTVRHCFTSLYYFVIDNVPVVVGVLVILPDCHILLLHVDGLEHPSVTVYHLKMVTKMLIGTVPYSYLTVRETRIILKAL